MSLLSHGHGEWLIAITSRVCCQCHYGPGRLICCLVDQDGASSPDQADDLVIGRRGHGEPETGEQLSGQSGN